MNTLKTSTNLQDADDFYQRLMDAHRDLSDEDSSLVNCRLVLLLANHIGDSELLKEAIAAARNFQQ